MKDIVNIQITPVKNILVNPLQGIIEKFNPNEYTPEQVNRIKKKGYVESTISEPTVDTDESKTSTGSTATSGSSVTSGSTTTAGSSVTSGSTKSTTTGTSIMNKDMGGTMMGWTPEQRQKFLQDLIKNKEKASKTESPKTLTKMNELINDLSTNVIDNKNFVSSGQNSMMNQAMNDKLLDAQRQYASLKSNVNGVNQTSINQLKAEYEAKIRKWTSDYEKSINYYKEYIKNQEKWTKELENQNLTLSDAMQRNTDKLNALAKKWNDAQNKINNFEKELLQSNNKKYDEVIKSLKQQLAAEKVKQSSIDEKIAQLRAEKAQLDALFKENVEKLKQAGLGSHCPKGFNMNDYIHKKKIPCWGCIL